MNSFDMVYLLGFSSRLHVFVNYCVQYCIQWKCEKVYVISVVTTYNPINNPTIIHIILIWLLWKCTDFRTNGHHIRNRHRASSFTQLNEVCHVQNITYANWWYLADNTLRRWLLWQKIEGCIITLSYHLTTIENLI